MIITFSYLVQSKKRNPVEYLHKVSNFKGTKSDEV